ncbi:hypothetical protein SUGI_0601610 [Cryptomeria japonica]|nr:hypothetical protein SUGI_0601610 [Cryptomeria japonica]
MATNCVKQKSKNVASWWREASPHHYSVKKEDGIVQEGGSGKEAGNKAKVKPSQSMTKVVDDKLKKKKLGRVDKVPREPRLVDINNEPAGVSVEGGSHDVSLCGRQFTVASSSESVKVP